MSTNDTTVGWAAPRRRWREAHRKEYAWGLFKPYSPIDHLCTVAVLLLILVGLGVIFTPAIWMPDSILRPELRSDYHAR